MTAAEIRLAHDLLRAVDRAIGAEAELRRCRETVSDRDVALSELRAELDVCIGRLNSLAAERDRLSATITEIHGSQSWRVGQAVVRPAKRALTDVRTLRSVVATWKWPER